MNYYFKFDLEGLSQSTGILNKVLHTSDPNLVILAWQVMSYCTDKTVDTPMDRQMDIQQDPGNDNTQRLKLALGKNEHDWQDLTGTYVKLEISHRENLIDKALVTPIQGL